MKRCYCFAGATLAMLSAPKMVVDVKRLAVSILVASMMGVCAWGDGDVPFRTGSIFGKAVRVTGGAAGSGRCVNIEGNLLYVGGKESLGVYDLSDPLQPKLLGETKGIASARQVARTTSARSSMRCSHGAASAFFHPWKRRRTGS